MSKTLAKAALIVGAVAAVATGVGAAAGAGLFTLSAAAAATVSTIATIASVAATGITLAATLTAKKPSATATGSQTSFSADPDAGIPYVVGRTGTAGNIIFRRGFDTKDAGDNDRQAFVAALSLGPVKSVGGMTVDRSPVGFAGTGAAIGAFAGFMWSMTQLGALPEPALGFGAGAGSPPGWTAQHRLSGIAAASWTLRFDTKAKLYQNGVPAPMWVVEGGLAYDPRKDSTYPGGSGPHRMADPADTAAYDAAVATWSYTDNPYLHALKWVHGVWQRDKSTPGSTWQRVMGMGAPIAGIDVGAFVEGANVADANGWKVGGVVYSGDSKWDTLKKLLQAGMGEPLALGARMSCLINAPKVSLATITIDDVVGDASVGATQPRRDRINTITPRYRLEANNWQLLPGAPISVAEHVTTDRGKRSKVQDYPFIQDSSQVGTAVRYDIENAREFGPIVLPLKLVWMGYKPGDCVTADLPELGLNGQPILLLNRDLDPSGGIVTMTARSETVAKHPYALGQTATPPPTPGVTGAFVVPTPREGAWVISGNGLSSSNATFPAIIVTGAVDFSAADAVIVEYRPFISGQGPDEGWRTEGIAPPASTRFEISSVMAGAPYEVAISYRSRGVVGGRRVLGPATTREVLTAEGSAALARLDIMASDGYLSRDEKRDTRITFQALNDDWVAKRALAMSYEAKSPAIGAARVAADSAIYNLGGYLNALVPSWIDTSVDTPVDPVPYRNAWAAAYQRVAELTAQLSLALGPDVVAVTNRVDRVASDSWLTTSEKPTERISYQALADDWSALRSKSINGGLEGPYPAIGAARVAADNAIYSLSGYLNGLTPYWLDTTSDTPIDPASYRDQWGSAYARVADLNAAITGLPGKDGSSALSVSAQPEAVQITADASGAPAAGVLPVVIAAGATLAGASVAVTSVTIIQAVGVTASVNGTTVQITALSGGADGEVVFDVVAAGQTVRKRVSVSVVRAGSNGARQQQLNISAPQLTWSSYQQHGSTVAINASSSGKLDLNLTGNMRVANGGTLRFQSKVQYRVAGGSWTDVPGSEVVSTQAQLVQQPTRQIAANVNGAGPYSLTGLTADGPYEVRALTRIYDGDQSTTTVVNLNLTGTQVA